MLDGAAKIAKLAARAKDLGMPAVAMTDHGNMFGAYEFQKTVSGAGLTPIIGIEAYVAPESRLHKQPVYWGDQTQRKTDEATGRGGDVSASGSYLHKTLLAASAQGLRNLMKISSLASLDGYYRKWPRMDDELLEQYHEGIIATTGCPSGAVQTRLRLGQYDEALKAAGKYQDIFGKENYFLELMDHGIPIQTAFREDLLRIAKHLNMPLLATNDSHYVTEDQAAAHDALLCVGTNSQVDDPTRFRFSGAGYYLRTADEMRALNSSDEWAQACKNTLLIAERVESYKEVFAHRDLAAKFPVPDGETEMTWLRKEAQRGAVRRYGAQVPSPITGRIEFELGVIEQMGFPGYFLVVADICKYARDNKIAIGPGRGSATGSMVSYVTGITELDPIEHSLLFERFLNPERISMPDVDLDFDERRRGDMIRYVTERYGEDNVSLIITYMTIKSKAAVKDANRILGYPFAVGEKITKAFPPAVQGKEIPLSAIFDDKNPRHAETTELQKLYEDDPDVKKVIDTARGIEGLIRGTGVHAAGVILSSEPLVDVMPIHRRADDGARITGFDGPSCEYMGSLKMDFLGLRNLTVISDAVLNVKANRGVDLDMLKLPLDDAKAYELLAAGKTLGVFQLDSTMMRDLTKLMAPARFEDISAVLALGRPGPMEAKSHINYALRKSGQQPVSPVHPELAEPLEEILGETYHLVVYQEQVMAIARKLAGYTLGGADILRRAMGKKKKEEMDKQWAMFSSGMKDNGYSAEAAQAVWAVLLPFSAYGFNKSPTAGYGLVSYWTAYLKANYPAEYMAALLTSVGTNKDKMAVYLAETRRMGVKVLPPDVNESQLRFAAVGDDIRFGLGAIRNVGENVVDGIISARGAQGRFGSFNDFLTKVPLPVCNKRVVESLVKAGGRGGPAGQLHRLPDQGAASGLQQAGGRVAGQGGRVRQPRAPPQGPDPGPRAGGRRGDQRQAQRGDRAGLAVRPDGRAVRSGLRPLGAHPRQRVEPAGHPRLRARDARPVRVQPPAGRGRGTARAQPRPQHRRHPRRRGRQRERTRRGHHHRGHQEDHQAGQRVGAGRARGPRGRPRGRVLPQHLPALRPGADTGRGGLRHRQDPQVGDERGQPPGVLQRRAARGPRRHRRPERRTAARRAQRPRGQDHLGPHRRAQADPAGAPGQGPRSHEREQARPGGRHPPQPLDVQHRADQQLHGR